jgi:hypothetical protein
MKKVLLFAMLTAASCVAFAQEPPKPVWMDKKPSARDFKFLFFTASGRGATPEEAREAAFAAAYAEGLQANGMVIASGQTLSDIKKKGLDAYIEGTNGHAVAIYCEERVRLADNRYIAYVLIQMARSAAQNPFFEDAEDLGDICQKKEFAVRKASYQKERERREAEQAKLDQKNQSSFWKYHHNNYFAITLGNGLTYGKLGGLSFSGRHGGLLGVGYHVSAGVGAEYYGDADYEEIYIHYSIGAKLYYYKDFYLGANYGIVEVERVPAVSGAKWRTEGYKVQRAPSFMAGVDLCARRFLLGIGAGVAMKSDGDVLPAWSFGLGFTF